MNTCFSESGDFNKFREDLVQQSEIILSGCLMVFVCDENNWKEADMSSLFQTIDVKLIGGVFPQIVYGTKNTTQGYLIVPIELDLSSVLVHGLDDDSVDFEAALDEAIEEDQEVGSMIVFVDGLSARINSFVDSLFALFGADVKYIGGGAGSLSFEQAPCIICNDGVFKGAAIIGLTKNALPVEVGHGWEPISKGHFVTQVDKNVVKEIDYKNAFDVYEELINPHMKAEVFNQDNFFEVAQSFPLGIKKIDGDYVVRDPISVNDDGHLVCVGELDEGDHIDILHGKPNALITSSGATAARLFSNNKGNTQRIFLMDCISRALFLEGNFPLELDAIEKEVMGDSSIFGALVLGEIANSGSGYLEFYNKTTVVSLM